MLGKIKSATEKADHFEVDDGSGRPFKVAKAALSPALTDKVRRLYCGGKVQRFADGGVAQPNDEPTAAPADDGIRARLERALAVNRRPSPEPAPASAPIMEEAAAPPAAPIAPEPAATQPAAAAAAAPAEETVSVIPDLGGVTREAPEVVPPSMSALPEAKAAGEEAARRIAEAGVFAQQALKERQTAEAQARAAEYNAAAALVATQDEATRRAEAEAARMREVYQRGENALRLQKERLAAREKDLVDPEAMRIETRRVFSKIDPVGLIVGAMMAGAAEAGLGKSSGAEIVLKTVNDAIDRDVLAQKLEKEGLRSSRLQAYQAAVGDIGNAGQLLKADQQLAAAAQARLEAQITQSAQGRIMLNKLAADLSSQARKTAEEAVNLITGQAIAQQKAKLDAESHVLEMRRGEAALLRSAAEIEASKRAEERADEQLGLARAKLSLDMRQQEMAERTAAAQMSVMGAGRQIARAGMLGQGLTPEQYMALPDEKERQLYVTTTDPQTGTLVYRRAKTEKDAEKFKNLSSGFERAISLANELDKLIAKPGYSPETILPGTSAKGRSEVLQTQLKFVIKEMEALGAIQKADAELMEPLIPDPQGVFTTDAGEAERMKQLTDNFQRIMEVKTKEYLTTTPGQKAKGAR